MCRVIVFLTSLFLAAAAAAEPVTISRLSGRVSIDGAVSAEEWRGATPLERWYEFKPGDNSEPKVRTVGLLAYDDRFLYVAMVCYDPDPAAIRAPFSERDEIAESTDYAGVILNPSGDRRTGFEFITTARGTQFDAINSDAGEEDAAPDFYWDSAGRITAEGWSMEIRIPFSSLRYSPDAAQNWGVSLLRNYPRDRRYQLATTPIPRGANCFICNLAPMTGLSDLPSTSHLTVAPYTTLGRSSAPVDDEIGKSLANGPVESEVGADAKWVPNANLALDATINPDFSQVESDAAAITANERFAIFFPEKRPFFLEGKDLFTTPIQAVYTRDINSPRWGGRATGTTGTAGSTAYTVLIADDRGGGGVIIPGPNSSRMARQDFQSRNLIGRVRHDIGESFVSFLVTDREIEGGGHNRVFGPDLLWRIGPNDHIRVQLLRSDSATPRRTDLAEEWDGRKLASHAGQLAWSHSTRRVDGFLTLIDRGDEFRADLGFVPQVGIRESYGRMGYTFRPSGFFSRVRAHVDADYTGQRDGALVYRFVAPGIEAEGRWSSYFNLVYSFDRIRAGEVTIERRQWHWEMELNPSRVFQHIEVEGRYGSDIDFEHSRPGDGGEIEAEAQIRPTDHLELAFNGGYRILDVEGGQRLFTARVARLKATYNFSARSFLRLIGQQERTDRETVLYSGEVARHDAGRSISALYAYKLNWQTVLYAGYGDADALTERGSYAPAGRQAFVKVSYAWQR